MKFFITQNSIIIRYNFVRIKLKNIGSRPKIMWVPYSQITNLEKIAERGLASFTKQLFRMVLKVKPFPTCRKKDFLIYKISVNIFK